MHGADGPDGPDGADVAVGAALADLLDDLAAEFPDVERRTTAGGTEFVAGGHAFARLTGQTAEFRLRPEIAAAAVRTGDTAASHLGREWVAFTPRTFDQYALDRAQSWFELGHRLAAESPHRH